MSENIIKKILKVLELTRRGVDGEKTAAEALLNSLLKKHNLTLSDLESLTKQQRDYKYKSTDHKSIILQIIVMVTSTDEIYSVKNEKIIVVYVTDAEHVQILESYSQGRGESCRRLLLLAVPVGAPPWP